jgi:hypothetical protein
MDWNANLAAVIDNDQPSYFAVERNCELRFGVELCFLCKILASTRLYKPLRRGDYHLG